MTSSPSGTGTGLENPQPEESAQIDSITDMTRQLLTRRYSGAPRFLRGVHPKDHGCVEAIFTVCESLAPEYQVGVFRKPGERFRAAIRFSNASALVTPDSPQEVSPPMGDPVVGPDGKPVLGHGSRGMAIKLYGVSGNRLLPDDGERTQDFLLINQPVFAFANVEDYQALNKAMVDHPKELPFGFFSRLMSSDVAVKTRAAISRGIIGRIKGLAGPPFQPPPMSPLDNTYFSAAPFGFGEGRVVKFAARPVNPASGDLGDAVNEPDYLRSAMRKRMAEAGGKDICFDFQIQVRTPDQLDIDRDIENMCTEWTDPFVTVARITIPPQDIASPERQEFCETLFYTPWHGLEDHRPLGGINRMRLKVYQASSELRGCPISPDLPSDRRRRGPPRGEPGTGGPPPRGGRGRQAV